MIVTIGKHKGKSAETLIIKEPSYITWVLKGPNPTGGLAALRSEVLRLIKIFDSKPYLMKCVGCNKRATNLSVYQANIHSREWWCDNCNPYKLGARDGTLGTICKYTDALDHCIAYKVRKDHAKTLIKMMARAKGLPARVGEQQAAAFFK